MNFDFFSSSCKRFCTSLKIWGRAATQRQQSIGSTPEDFLKYYNKYCNFEKIGKICFWHDSRKFSTKKDVYAFYKNAIEYRNKHKEEYAEIARFVFCVTHKDKLGDISDDDIDFIRFEFIALEAPGTPENDDSEAKLEAFVDFLWERLRLIVDEKSKNKGTV